MMKISLIKYEHRLLDTVVGTLSHHNEMAYLDNVWVKDDNQFFIMRSSALNFSNRVQDNGKGLWMYS